MGVAVAAVVGVLVAWGVNVLVGGGPVGVVVRVGDGPVGIGGGVLVTVAVVVGVPVGVAVKDCAAPGATAVVSPLVTASVHTMSAR